MLNNNHGKSGCGFSEELVSYLYDEANEAEKAIFKKHLHNCPACTVELAAFSAVQFSINDWKLNEFALIETPIIEIPYEIHDKSTELSSVGGSWLSGLRNLFTLSPAWSMTAASLAVLVVCFGIALLALNSRQANETAAANKNASKPLILPNADKTPPQSTGGGNENILPNKSPEPLLEVKPGPEAASSNGVNSDTGRIVKAANNQRPIQQAEKPRKNNEAKAKNRNEKLPTKAIDEADEEDNTLRLAELFDEIDAK